MLLDGIDCVIFDLGGVLVDLDREACIAAFTEIGFPGIAGLLDNCYPSPLFQAFERGEVSTHEMCDAVRREARRDLSDEAICRAYSRFVVTLPPGKLRLMRSLRERGLRVYLLSNTNELIYPIIRDRMFTADGLRAEAYFDKAYLSYEMHLLKPAPEIFLRMVADSGIRPERSLFLDDGERNVAAARELGFRVYRPEAHEDFTPLFGL